MNQKGFVNIIAITVLLVVIAGGVAYYLIKKQAPAPIVQQLPDEIANWKTYRYGFEFKYPATVKIDDNYIIKKKYGDEEFGDIIVISEMEKDDVIQSSSCNPLKNWRPLSLCKVVKIGNDGAIIYGIQELCQPEQWCGLIANFILLENDRFIEIIFEGIIPDLPEATKKIADEFVRNHPRAEFPNQEGEILSRLIDNSLKQEISKPAKEISKGMELLDQIVSTFKFIK